MQALNWAVCVVPTQTAQGSSWRAAAREAVLRAGGNELSVASSVRNGPANLVQRITLTVTEDILELLLPI